jgi:hypothetical protein
MKRSLLSLGVALCLVGLVALMLAGCEPARAREQELRVGGRLDVLPLIEQARTGFATTTGISLTSRPSESDIQDLKAGKLDVLVVGRAPSAGELAGLVDYPVALDAVCIVIDVRSYVGGVQVDLNHHPKLFKAASGGLRGLSLDEARHVYNNRIRGRGPVWQWEGSHYQFRGTGTGADGIGEDPQNPGYAVGEWVKTPVYLVPDLWRLYRVDTQSVLFEKLGLSEADVVAGDGLLLPKFLESEEELVAYRYSRGPAQASIGNDQFPYQLAVLSRRITAKAIDHGFRLRALEIDGIDPVAKPATIYDGTYSLSRKIHLLMRPDAPPHAQALAAFLLSPDGQQAVAAAGFLPLVPDR